MKVRAELTPNPATVKFIADDIMIRGVARFDRNSDLSAIPLISAIFAIDEIKSVFLSPRFIAVTVEEIWNDTLIERVCEAINGYSESGVVELCPPHEDDTLNIRDADAERPDTHAATIKDILERFVRPAVANDGGDIQFAEFRDGILYVTMKGACDGCPSAAATLRLGVLNLLKRTVGNIIDVREAEPRF